MYIYIQPWKSMFLKRYPGVKLTETCGKSMAFLGKGSTFTSIPLSLQQLHLRFRPAGPSPQGSGLAPGTGGFLSDGGCTPAGWLENPLDDLGGSPMT